jgi:hypothetical protein
MCWRVENPNAKKAMLLYRDWLQSKPLEFNAPVIISNV